MALADIWSTVDPGQTYDTSNPEVAPVAIASTGSQWDQMVYGSFRDHKEYIDQALQQIGQQAGLPANFDWKPYLEQAAQQQIQQSGKVWDERYNNNAEPIYRAASLAAQTNPQLAPIAQQIGPGTQAWQQGEALRQSRADSSKASDKQNTVRFLSVLASAAGAAFFGPAAGAAGSGGESAVAGFGEAAYAGGGAAAAGGGAAAGGTTVGAYGANAGAPTVTGTATGSGQFVNAAGQALPAGATAAPALAGGTTAGGTFTPAVQGATTAGAGAGGGVGTAAATTVGGTALSRILDGSGSSADYLSVAGGVLPAALSAYGSYEQSQAMQDLAKRYEGYGAPYRQTLADISQDPSKFYDSPTATKATDAILRRLSISGNPAGNPYSQALGVDALYKEYGAERDRLAGYGGLTQYAAAAPGVAQNAIGAQGAIYGDIGYGIGNVMNPKPTLAQQLAQYRAAGGSY